MRFIGRFIRRSDSANETAGEIEIAISEAVTSAMIHGNRENADQYVDVICRCSMDGEVLLPCAMMDEVSFEGNGTVVRAKKRVKDLAWVIGQPLTREIRARAWKRLSSGQPVPPYSTGAMAPTQDPAPGRKCVRHLAARLP